MDSRSGEKLASVLTHDQRRLYYPGESPCLSLNREVIGKPGQMCYNGISKGATKYWIAHPLV
jgi:hypothetical protein